MVLSAIYPPRHRPAQCLAAAQLRRDPSLSAYVSGDAPSRIAGDSCARTTWENATRTAAWLGLQVQPLALRETAGTVLYWVQGRM